MRPRFEQQGSEEPCEATHHGDDIDAGRAQAALDAQAAITR